jgi:hypothetical protein
MLYFAQFDFSERPIPQTDIGGCRGVSTQLGAMMSKGFHIDKSDGR